ncbi:MAG TPA: aspartyl-phosphate phosphatase Spo0E family protein [Clostridiaceae bacterium]|nr:aspartyl-phosphate phosphatase Spo0E family protein [Clostridiaceae bacterium]
MEQFKKSLEAEIDSLKDELDNLLKTKSCLSVEVLNVSKKLDALIVEYYNAG